MPSVLAVDCGGTTIKIGLVRDDTIVASRELPVGPEKRLDQMLTGIADALDEACTEVAEDARSCVGIGFSLAALTNADSNRVLATARGKFDDAGDLDLQEWALKTFGLRLVLESDSRCALIGEWRYGAGRGAQDLVMVSLGTAIGVGVLFRGHLIRGAHYKAGLGGHFVVNPGGRECTCGAHGCVTAETATWALPAIVREHRGFASSVLAAENHLDYESLFRCAALGDSVACEIATRSVRLWGAMVVSLVHAFDPVRIILGGGVLRSAVIADAIQEYLDQEAWTPWGRVEVRRAKHVGYSALLGAASLVTDPVVAL